MLNPVVVSAWIYKRFLLMLLLSLSVCKIVTTFRAFVGKAIGNVTGLDIFPHCQIPIAIYRPVSELLSMRISKPVFVIFLV